MSISVSRNMSFETTKVELPRRLAETLDLISRGYTDEQIGAELSISVSTVNTYVRRLYALYGANSRAKLVAQANSQSITALETESAEVQVELTVAQAELEKHQKRLELMHAAVFTDDQAVLVADSAGNVIVANDSVQEVFCLPEDWVPPTSISLEQFLVAASTCYENRGEFVGKVITAANRHAVHAKFTTAKQDGDFCDFEWNTILDDGIPVGGLLRSSMIPEHTLLPDSKTLDALLRPLKIAIDHELFHALARRVAIVLSVTSIEWLSWSPIEQWIIQDSWASTEHDTLSTGPVGKWANTLLEEREIVCGNVDYLVRGTPLRNAIRKRHMSSMLAVPVRSSGTNASGALLFFGPTPHNWTSQDLLVAHEFAMMMWLHATLRSMTEEVPNE